MFTAKSEEFDFYWGSKQGADAYVSKQTHPQVLLDTVNQFLPLPQQLENYQQA
jgi:twitching motility two-component system response regulator PilH